MSFLSNWQFITLFKLNEHSNNASKWAIGRFLGYFRYIIEIHTAFFVTEQRAFCTDLLLFYSELLYFILRPARFCGLFKK